MPSASRLTTPVGIALDFVEGRYAELADYTVSFETFRQDLDVAPYVARPGHRPLIAAGTSIVEFSRTADLQPVMEVIGRNIESLTGVRA